MPHQRNWTLTSCRFPKPTNQPTNQPTDELAALLLAHKRNGLSLPKAAAQLCAFGVGLPPMTMVYLRLDQPARPKSDERKALLAAYEMRTTVAELGWLQLDSEYDSPALEAQRQEDLNRRVLSQFSSLKEDLFRLHDPTGRRLEKLGLGTLAGAAIAQGGATEELKRMVGSSKAGRREAKGERSRRQLGKLKEQGKVGGVVVPQPPQKGQKVQQPPPPAAARVVDQRQQARKLFGGGAGGGEKGGGAGSQRPSKPKGGGGGKGGGAKKEGGDGGGGGAAAAAAAKIQSQPPQQREKR